MNAVLPWPQRPDMTRRHGSLLMALSLHGAMWVATVYGLQSSLQPPVPREVVITLLSQTGEATRPLTTSAARPVVPRAVPKAAPQSATQAAPQRPAVPTQPPPLPASTLAPTLPPMHAATTPTVSAPVSAVVPVVMPETAAPTAAPAPAASATTSVSARPVAAAPRTPVNVSGVDYLSPPKVDYPISARRAGIEGKVTLRLLIDEKGLPQRADIQQSSGHARLDEAARTAVLRAQFRPHIEDGQPMPVYALVPINFSLR